MSARIAAKFDELRAAKRKALVAYLCLGDPSLEASIDLAIAIAEEGADVLELGVPFSDPTSDGPAIARSAERALRSGTTLAKILAAVPRLRAATNIPLVLFSYVNPILAMGEHEAARRAKHAGVDGMLIVDLPPEEGDALRASAKEVDLAMIPLVAPTTNDERARAILEVAHRGATGFVYLVSKTGVTGGGDANLGDARAQAARLRDMSSWPIVVGFGIDSPESAARAAGAFGEPPDGVVVGTAIVNRIERGEDVRGLVRGLRRALG